MTELTPQGRLPWWLSGEESTCQCRRCGTNAHGQKDPLEKGTATHSSILAWGIPWTEERGGQQFMGPQESDMTDRACMHISSSDVFWVWGF